MTHMRTDSAQNLFTCALTGKLGPWLTYPQWHPALLRPESAALWNRTYVLRCLFLPARSHNLGGPSRAASCLGSSCALEPAIGPAAPDFLA